MIAAALSRIMRLVDLPKGNYIRMIKHEFKQNSKC